MNCDESRQRLLDANVLATPAALEALRHVDGCDACRQAIADYARLADQLKTPEGGSRPTGGWDGFENKMLAVAQAGPARSNWWAQPLKLAAAFLLGILVMELLLPRPVDRDRVATNLPQMPASSPAFTPQEVAQHAAAFNEVSEVFDRKTRWVLLANNASDVGLSDQPVAAAHKLLLLRLTMSRGGEQVSASDLVIIPGQSAKLTIPLGQNQSLRYEIGTTTGEPTKLSLWAELQSAAGGQAIGALATQLNLKPGQKVAAGELLTTSGAYELKVGFSQALTSASTGKSGT